MKLSDTLELNCGIPRDRASRYSKSLIANGIDTDLIEELSEEVLIRCGVEVIGDRLRILKMSKVLTNSYFHWFLIFQSMSRASVDTLPSRSPTLSSLPGDRKTLDENELAKIANPSQVRFTPTADIAVKVGGTKATVLETPPINKSPTGTTLNSSNSMDKSPVVKPVEKGPPYPFTEVSSRNLNFTPFLTHPLRLLSQFHFKQFETMHAFSTGLTQKNLNPA